MNMKWNNVREEIKSTNDQNAEFACSRKDSL